ncbi:hypothetical protein EDB89DRAFT_2230895 [Lactarius sanguifluus]|nr:hypothetical protein EDB89DRAFT_2230895 [Lactarius sanguifluus]
MSSSLAPSQTCPTPRSVQLPRELWCDITARILGDYLYDLIIGADTHDDDDLNDENADQRLPTPTHPGDTCRYSVPDRPEWDALATLLHTSRLVRSCALDHLSFLSHRPDTPSPAPPKAHDGYRPLVAHLRALRRDEIDMFVLEERDYAPGARFFGLPRSLVGPCACMEPEEDQGLPPVLVLARLRHTLAASDAFAREGWDWFPYNAPEVYDIGCTTLLVETYRAVPAYVRSALLRRVVERIAALQVARITRAIEKTRNRIEMTQLRLGAKHPGDITDPAVRTSGEDLLVSVKRVLATELNITL